MIVTSPIDNTINYSFAERIIFSFAPSFYTGLCSVRHFPPTAINFFYNTYTANKESLKYTVNLWVIHGNLKISSTYI